jgi:hypothetical protein
MIEISYFSHNLEILIGIQLKAVRSLIGWGQYKANTAFLNWKPDLDTVGESANQMCVQASFSFYEMSLGFRFSFFGANLTTRENLHLCSSLTYNIFEKVPIGRKRSLRQLQLGRQKALF